MPLAALFLAPYLAAVLLLWLGGGEGPAEIVAALVLLVLAGVAIATIGRRKRNAVVSIFTAHRISRAIFLCLA